MPDHHCRYCHNVLTLDNIYPSDHKHKNWICKTCSNQKKKDRQQRQYNNRSNPKDVAFNQKADELVEHITRSCANHIRADNFTQNNNIYTCNTCFAYNTTDSTCHLNPPPWHRVATNDWCKQHQIKPNLNK